MQKILHLSIVAFCLAISITACRKTSLPSGSPDKGEEPSLPEETVPAVFSPVTKRLSPNVLGFYEALPARYEESEVGYPLLICLHGGGQYGNGTATDMNKILNDGIPKMLKENKFPPSFKVNNKNYSFIVIAPQMVKFASTDDVDSVMQYALANYRVNPKRIYLWGYSLGGRSVSDYAVSKVNDIAAISIMGGMSQINETLEEKCRKIATSGLAVWQFHNRDDSAWYYSEAQRYHNRILDFNPAVTPKLTTFEVGEGRLHHDCWTRGTDPSYKENGLNIYEWMLTHSR